MYFEKTTWYPFKLFGHNTQRASFWKHALPFLVNLNCQHSPTDFSANLLVVVLVFKVLNLFNKQFYFLFYFGITNTFGILDDLDKCDVVIFMSMSTYSSLRK